MRYSNLKRFKVLIFSIVLPSLVFAQVKVAADADLGTAAHPSSVLEVFSNVKGFLPPRHTTAQRNAITTPAEGLVVYNTTEDCLNIYQGGSWETYCNLRYSTSCNCVEYLNNYGPAQAWIPINVPDHDWYEVGGTTPPNSINDNQYTQGNVAIGRTNPVYRLDVNGEITSRAANAFRMRYTAYSLIQRIDANRYYHLITNLNDQDGSWNTLRPYFVELATGNVSIVNNGIFARHSDRFIGLNINTPTQRLDVNGGARVRTLPVGLTSDQVVLADATGVLRKLPISTIVQTGKDHDWYEVGTTEPPNSINDNQFTQGRVGIGHANPTAGLHVNHSDGAVAQGTLGVGAVPLPGAGVKMVWSPRNAAFRAGRTSAAQWDEASMGNYSTGFGYNTTASGTYSFASGVNSQASGVTSIAMGNGANASSTNSIALGFQTVASGNASVAIGYQASATGVGSKSFGGQTVASGSNAIALGEFTYARSRGEIAVGMFNTNYTPLGGAATFNPGDRVFCVGIGSTASARANTLRIYKNGKSRFDGNVDVVTSTTSADEGLYVTNNGTAISTVVSSSNAANTNFGLYVRHTGLGEGARIRILNAASTAPVLTAYQAGVGEAGYFRTLNATSTDPVVTSYNGGLGRGVYSTIQNAANTEPAVAAYTSGTGEAIYAGGTITTGAIIGTNFRDGGGVWRNTSYLAGAPGVQGTTNDGQAGVAGSVWKPTLADLNNTSGGYFSNIYGIPNSGSIFAINYTRVSYVTAGGTIRKIDGPGAAGTIVSDLDDNPVLMTSMESPEILFTDYGDGQLVNGKAIIKLDPIFSKNIIVNEKNKIKVFVQLEGDCNGVYVTNKTANGFEVHELKGGTSNVTFSYEVVANRANTTRHGNEIIFDSSRRFEPGPEEDAIEVSGRSQYDEDRLDLEENFAPDERADKEEE